MPPAFGKAPASGLQAAVRELRVGAHADCPRRKPSAEAVRYGRRVGLAARQPKLGDVGQPKLVRRAGGEIPSDHSRISARMSFSDADSESPPEHRPRVTNLPHSSTISTTLRFWSSVQLGIRELLTGPHSVQLFVRIPFGHCPLDINTISQQTAIFSF